MPRNTRTLSKPLAVLLPLAAATVLFAPGCARKDATRAQSVPVTVARVEKRSMPYAIVATGTVEPIQTADVGSQVGGTVVRIDFREGQEVQSGQALFELDARPFRAALSQASGALARDRAQWQTARLDAERSEKLWQQNLLSQSDWDGKRASADGLLGTLQSDSAQVAKARLDLEYATIRSPLTGRTGKFNVHVGDYVKAATSEPLVTVNQMRPINVRFAVSEDDRASVMKYRAMNPRVMVRPGSDDSVEIAGRLAFVDNAVDPTTGTLTLKGEFANGDGRLWPGAFVEVRLVMAMQKDAIVVPAPAISNGQQGTYVYVLNADSTATARPVVVERSGDVSVVISEGLVPGEIVVTDGQFRIMPGARLVVRETGKPKSRP